MNLWEFAYKDVKIIDIDGNEWIGHCEGYTQDLDNDNGLASISVYTSKGCICFYENEIRSIEEI